MSPLLMLLAPALAADGLDGHHFKPAPGFGSTLDHTEVWRIEAQLPRSFGLTGLFDASSGGMVQVYEDWNGTTETALLDDVMALNLGVRGAITRRLALTAVAPVYLASVGQDGPQGAGFGDVRIAAPIGLLAPEGRGLSVGLVPLLDLPTGDETALLGNAGLGVGALVAGGWRTDRLTADLNFGYEQLPDIALDNQTGGGRLIASLGAGFALTDGIGVGGELLTERALQPNEITGTDAPAEGLLSVRGRTDRGLSWRLGGGAGLSEGAGSPEWRAFAGVGWAYIDDPNRDPDQDGILGRDDACPREPEVKNGWKDVEGCPDALSDLALVVQDEEGTRLGAAALTVDGAPATINPDGTLRLSGRMPDAALAVTANADGYVQGSLSAANLDEGLNSRTMTLAWLPGTTRVIARDAAGAPVAAKLSFKGPTELAARELGETGRTQFVLPGGEWQLLVEAPGFGTEGRVIKIDPQQNALTKVEFTLTPPRAEVQNKEVVISEAVLFDFNADTLRADSEPLLRQVAGQLLAHPEVLLVEVQGHTDDVGDAAYNLDLSQRRVEAVRAWLVANGVAAERLVAKGYGETKPIASNATEAGQAQNRRVQFVIVKKGE